MNGLTDFDGRGKRKRCRSSETLDAPSADVDRTWAGSGDGEEFDDSSLAGHDLWASAGKQGRNLLWLIVFERIQRVVGDPSLAALIAGICVTGIAEVTGFLVVKCRSAMMRLVQHDRGRKHRDDLDGR